MIRISSPTTIHWGSNPGLLFYIAFSTEFIDRQSVVAKSDEFRQLTTALVGWLKSRFVSWRGPDCFDNEDENVRLFGERLRSTPKT